MTGDGALAKLGESTSRAAMAVLEQLAPGQAQAGGVSVVPGDGNPLDGSATPAVAMSVSYVDGVTGGNVLVLSLVGARTLAAAMMGGEVPDAAGAGEDELSELELSAVAEAANQIMAGAAASVSAVLGTEVGIDPPQTRTFASPDEADGAYPATPYAVRMTFTLCGETCRLVQLVPNAFVVRMTKALHELGAEALEPGHDDAPALAAGGPAPRPSLRGISVRVSAELGRTRMPSAELVDLPAGAVVELDRHPDDAIDLYVNGRRFATGRLLVSGGTEWAVRIERVLSPASDPAGRSEELA